MKNLRKGKVVCITSGKGGVGKTVLTANLAGIIESLNKKVLLIDLDWRSCLNFKHSISKEYL